MERKEYHRVKNQEALNSLQRTRIDLTDFPGLLRLIIGWALFLTALEKVIKENEEKRRYAEQRRADL